MRHSIQRRQGKARRLFVMYENNKKNHRKNLEDCEAILILLAKDIFYNF